MHMLNEIVSQTGCIPVVDTAEYIEIAVEADSNDGDYQSMLSTYDMTNEDQKNTAMKVLSFIVETFPVIFERHGLEYLLNQIIENGGFQEGTAVACFFECIPNNEYMECHTLKSISARYFNAGTVTNLKFTN